MDVDTLLDFHGTLVVSFASSNYVGESIMTPTVAILGLIAIILSAQCVISFQIRDRLEQLVDKDKK
ncbi:MAG: hypothetical protein A2289_16140 [Deltaproteobacteria bacterium RIFOXYA12_FULL_58_15]|nr:MAG: hypothetical protein A2289_16140 [Deltaproteobacteria bacterium RIFOXYA12_FULL_58_15]OGR15226.1 MAG: hypothetical protein A2341_09030 [Deltaproteobacteria bacterium RIFOXYB12_FULL_58_9]